MKTKMMMRFLRIGGEISLEPLEKNINIRPLLRKGYEKRSILPL